MSIYFCLVKLVPVEQQAEKRSLYGQMIGWTQGAYFQMKEICLDLSSLSSSFPPPPFLLPPPLLQEMVYAYEYLNAYMHNYLK